MNATALTGLINKEGNGLENLIYISLNNGKVLYITEEMKTKGEFSIEGEFIKIVNHNFTANGMTDYKVRDVIEYHAIEFVECAVFAQDTPSLIKLTSVKDFTTDRNYDITDNINAQETKSSLRVSHPNLTVTAGGSLTKEYEITMSGSTLKVELSGENKQLGMAENPANMYVLPFNMDALYVKRISNTSKAEFEIKAIEKGEHEILVRIGNQELYFKVIVGSDDLLTNKVLGISTDVKELVVASTTKTITPTVKETKSGATITYETSDSQVATVSGGVVSFVGEGSAVITVKATDTLGNEVSSTVNVKAVIPVTITAKIGGSVVSNDTIDGLTIPTSTSALEFEVSGTYDRIKPLSVSDNDDENDVIIINDDKTITPNSLGTATITYSVIGYNQAGELEEISKVITVNVTGPDTAIVSENGDFIVSEDRTSIVSGEPTETQSDETNEEEPVATTMLLDDEPTIEEVQETVIDLGLDGAAQVTIAKGGSLQLDVTVTPEQELTISSSNSDVIVDENGLVSVIENATKSQAVLSIKATDGTIAKLKVIIK